MDNIELEYIINQKINKDIIQDYAPNGLQVEGRKQVKRIVTGVTACQALLDSALIQKADAIIVHHGYFWKNESPIVCNMQRRRLKTLLTNDINLYSWHLPLDIHPELGNNVQLAATLNIKIIGKLKTLVYHGILNPPMSGKALCQHLENILKRNILHYNINAPNQIKHLAWSTGGGQRFINIAAQAGMDAFITGEVSEQTIHVAREHGLHFYAAGHHATEQGGIYALGKWLIKNYKLDVIFIDIPNPA